MKINDEVYDFSGPEWDVEDTDTFRTEHDGRREIVHVVRRDESFMDKIMTAPPIIRLILIVVAAASIGAFAGVIGGELVEMMISR